MASANQLLDRYRRNNIKKAEKSLKLLLQSQDLGCTEILYCGQCISGEKVIIYLDLTANFRVAFTEDNIVTPAFFVKGLPTAPADLSNREQIEWLKQVFERNCYYTISCGEFHVNFRLLGGGWGWWNALYGVLGAGQIVGGIILATATFGFAAPASAALISSGVSGTMYALATDDEKCSFGDFATQTAVGAVTGALSGGISSFGTATLSKIGYSAVGGLCGKLGGTVTQGTCNVIRGKEFKKDIDLSAGSVIASVVSGGVSGALGSGSSALSKKALDGIKSVTKGAVIGGLLGAAGGAVSGVTTQFAANCVEIGLGRMVGIDGDELYLLYAENSSCVPDFTKRDADKFPLLLRFEDSKKIYFLGKHKDGGAAFIELDSSKLPSLVFPTVATTEYQEKDPKKLATIWEEIRLKGGRSKREKDLKDGLLQATTTGLAIGGAIGAIQGVKYIREQIKKAQELEKQKLSQEKDKNVKKDTQQQLGEKDKSNENTDKSKSAGTSSETDKADKRALNTNSQASQNDKASGTSSTEATAKDKGTRNNGGDEQPNNGTIKDINNNIRSRIETLRALIANAKPFFGSDPKQFQEFCRRKGISANSSKAAFCKDFMTFVENNKDPSLIEKFIGHLENEKHVILTDTKKIHDGGKGITFRPETGAQIIISNSDKSSAKLTHVECNDPGDTLILKTYTDMVELCKATDPAEQRCLSAMIDADVTAYDFIAKFKNIFAGEQNAALLIKLKDVWTQLDQGKNPSMEGLYTDICKNQQFNDLCNDFMLHVRNLKNGETLLLPAGCYGHTFYLTFSNENGSIRPTIYNCGTLADQHEWTTTTRQVYPLKFDPVSLSNDKEMGLLADYAKDVIACQWLSEEFVKEKVYLVPKPTKSQDQPKVEIPKLKKSHDQITGEEPKPLQSVKNCTLYGARLATEKMAITANNNYNDAILAGARDTCENLKLLCQNPNTQASTTVNASQNTTLAGTLQNPNVTPTDSASNQSSTFYLQAQTPLQNKSTTSETGITATSSFSSSSSSSFWSPNQSLNAQSSSSSSSVTPSASSSTSFSSSAGSSANTAAPIGFFVQPSSSSTSTTTETPKLARPDVSTTTLFPNESDFKYVEDNSCNCELLLKLAANGDADAQAKLGRNYLRNLGVKTDEAKAKELLTAAAKSETAAGLCAQGMLCEAGLGISADLGKAVRLYQQAGALGYPPALNELPQIKCYRKVG